MLFLHGFPEFWYAWRAQWPAFAADHLVVAPDLRGYNLSSKPAAVEQYATDLLVEDVRALAEHLGYQRFVLVGHDWGGFVAWSFALQHPDLVEKLVIINAPHPGVFGNLLRENIAQQQASQYISVFRNTPGMEDWFAANNFAMLRKAFAGTGLKDGVFSQENWQQYEAAWAQPGALQGALNYYRAMKPASAAPGFQVSVPTLVLWGEQDPALTIHNLDGLGAYVPSLVVKRFPDASHWLIHEYPEEVNQAIQGFLASQ